MDYVELTFLEPEFGERNGDDSRQDPLDKIYCRRGLRLRSTLF